MNLDADAIIDILGLRPHPEGGWYHESWRPAAKNGERPASTAIYYLLKAGEASHWHRVDATETWHLYGGDPLELRLAATGDRQAETRILGTNLATGERPQIVVPHGWWQAARPLGAWTLVGCTVAPGFRFEGFELAPPGWEPGRGAMAKGG